MRKLVFKVIIILILNFLVFKSLYLDEYNRMSNSRSYIRQVHSYEDFKYWSKEDGSKYCTALDTVKKEALYSGLEKFAFEKTNVVLLTQTDLVGCKDYIRVLATEFHKRNLAVAMYLDLSTDHRVFFKENYSGINPESIQNKYKDLAFSSDWIDYIIFDKGMEYLTFNDRRSVQTELRKIFPKPFIGFRFPNNITADSNGKHPNRPDMDMSLFLPADDDGDFIVTSIKVAEFKRTLVFVEDTGVLIEKVNGIFL